MEGSTAEGWEGELGRWLEPFLVRLRRKAQRYWAPFYLKGLILPGERKSIEPLAARVAPGDTQQLHHFVSTSPWPTAPLEEELVRAARSSSATIAGSWTASPPTSWPSRATATSSGSRATTRTTKPTATSGWGQRLTNPTGSSTNPWSVSRLDRSA